MEKLFLKLDCNVFYRSENDGKTAENKFFGLRENDPDWLLPGRIASAVNRANCLAGIDSKKQEQV